MRLAFVLLAHGDPAHPERLVRLLTKQGHCVAIHYDANSPLASYQRLRAIFDGNEAVRFARRTAVGWGQWGVVQGALNCLLEIEDAGWNPDYVYQISGMDYPIRSSAELLSFLRRHRGHEFIESVPANDVNWVKTGPQRERYQYYWWLNWRDQPRITDLIFHVQERLGIKRRFVRGITPYIGSQWWTLTWNTLKKIMALAANPDIVAFFKTTLVPDELFFQTMVRLVAPDALIMNASLTLFNFSDYGYPVVYCDDHLDYLTRQPFFMARKFSIYDEGCRDRLDEIWRGRALAAPFNDDDIGAPSPCYERHRLTYRHGIPETPVIGASSANPERALDRLAKPFFAVVGGSALELNRFRSLVGLQPELLLHGELFHRNHIEFAANREDYAGFGKSDICVRDLDPVTFLVDVLRAERTRISGFLLRLNEARRLPDAMIDASRLRLFVLPADRATAFLETLIDEDKWAHQSACVEALNVLAAPVVADRFRRFARRFQSDMEWLEQVGAQPSVSLAHVDAVTWTSWRGVFDDALGIRLSEGGTRTHHTSAHVGLESEQVRDILRTKLIEASIAGSAIVQLERFPPVSAHDWRLAAS